MNKERTFEEIAKSLSKLKRENDPIIIKATDVEVVVLASKGYMIGGYILRAIHDIAEKYRVIYYVSSDAKGNPYVLIHL